MHVDVAVARRIGVDIDVGLVDAVGPSGDLGREPAACVGDRPIDRGAHDGGAVGLHDLGEPGDTELRGPDLCAEVADEALEPVVRPHGEHHVAALATPVDDLEQRVPRTLRPDVLGERVVTARHCAARIAVMALDRRDQQELAFGVEDRREDVEVGEMTTAVIRIVRDDHVAGLQLVGEELDCEANGQRGGQHELRDADRQRGEPPLTVEDRRVAFVALVQDRGRRGARDERRHFEAHRLHRGPDDLGGDLIDRA